MILEECSLPASLALAFAHYSEPCSVDGVVRHGEVLQGHALEEPGGPPQVMLVTDLEAGLAVQRALAVLEDQVVPLLLEAVAAIVFLTAPVT